MTTETASIHLRISRQLNREIAEYAKRSGKTQSSILREAAEQFLSDSRISAQAMKNQAEVLARLDALGKMLDPIGLQISDIHELARSGQ